MQEEAEALKQRFAKVNRAKFARDFGVKGGQAVIYQHINAVRPINLDAARSYAQGFNCSLEEISPRLAKQVASAAALPIGTSDSNQNVEWPFAEWIDIERVKKLGRDDLSFIAGKLDAAIQEREQRAAKRPAQKQGAA